MPIKLAEIHKENDEQEKKEQEQKYNIVGGLKLSKNSKNAQSENKPWYKDIVKGSNLFDDGYDFGDITKTTLSTTANVGANLLKGVANIGAAAGKLIVGGTATVADALGYNDYADRLKYNIANRTNPVVDLFQKASDATKDNSVLGSTSRDVMEGTGYYAGMLALQSVGVPWQATSGVTSVGNELPEAYAQGASNAQAWLSAGISAGAEIGSEYVFGGIKLPGTGKTTETILNKATSKIENKALKYITQAGVNILGEGAEEVISGIGSAIGKQLTYMNDKELNEIYTNEDKLQDFVMGALVSAVTIGANPTTYQNVKTGRSLINGLTVDEEENLANSKLNNNQNPSLNNQLNQNNENYQKSSISSINNLVQTNNENLFNYNETNNQKINNLYQSAKESRLNNSQETQQLIDTISKVIEDKNYNILLDNTITNENGDSVNAKITTNPNNEIEIRINPDSDRAGEFLLVHEISHAIKTPEMIQLVNDFANRNEGFAKAVKEIETTYGKNLTSEEVFTDVCGQLFGNQEFINTLETQNTEQSKSLIRQIYEAIKKLLNRLTSEGRYRNFVQDLEVRWRNAYKNTTMQQSVNNLNGNVNYAKGKLMSGEDVVVSDDVNGSHPSKQEAEQNLKSMLGIKYVNSKSGTEISIENKDIKKYLNDGYNNQKNTRLKKRISGNYGEILEIAKMDTSKSKQNYKGTNRGKQGFDYYNVTLAYPIKNVSGEIIDYKYYEARLVVRKDNNNNFAYDLDNFKEKKGAVLDKTSLSIMADKSAHGSFNDTNIPQTDVKVNSDTSTKYSMPLNENNTQELDNSSFSLDDKGRTLTKEQQEYFKDSKVRDKNGNLKTMYHGTRNDFTVFDINKSGESSNNSKVGFWFTENSDGAKNFANSVWYGNNKDAKSMEVYLNITNPKIYEEVNNNTTMDQLKKQSEDIKNQKKPIEEKYSIDSLYPNYSSYDGNLFLKYCAMYRSKYSSYTQDEMLEFIKEDYNIKANENDYFNDVKKYSELLNEEEKIERQQDNLRYTDSYEQFRGDIYSIVGKDLYDANIGGTGVALNNENEVIEKYVSKLKKEGYDGIIIKDTNYDTQTLGEKNTQYVAFYPSQIKNVDNTNPTLNEDIRYSQNNSLWQAHLEKNYKSNGTRTYFDDVKLKGNEILKSNTRYSEIIKNESDNKKAKKILNPNEIANLSENDALTTPELSKVKVEKGDGESHYWSNIKDKTNMLNTTQKEHILSNDEVKYYKKITNEESLNEAFEKLNKGGASETLRWAKMDSKDATATDVAEGWILLKQYSDSGDYNSMVEVAKKMRDIGTQAGQTVQAFNIMARMSPEGMVKYAQSELSDAYEKMVKGKTKEWIDKYKNDFDLKPNEVQFIMDTMQEVKDMPDGYDKKAKLAEIQKMMTDKLPPDKDGRIKSWMRISMLFNPKTQVRNVAGNAIIAPVNYIGDIFASRMDKKIAKKTGVRTTGNMNIKAILEGMKKGAYQATNDYKKGINTKDMDGNRFEISNRKSFSDKNLIGKSLNRTEALLNYVMDAGDRVFSEASFENSLQNQMILNNTTEVTQEMIDIAHEEALSRTWNDNNKYTKFVLGVRSGLNNIKLGGYGLGDVLIPFAKTPANLTKAIVDYSPVGLVNSLTKYKAMNNAIETGQFTAKMQHDFVQTLGKATAGTMLYVLGMALAKAGITSGKSDDDKDTRDFIKNTLGINSYSIKIGNKSFTYDWAQPIAAPLSIMANIETSKKNKEQALLEGVVNSLDTAGSILLEQSFLSSINDVLSDNAGVVSGIINEVLELPSRAIPTFSKQIVDLTDTTQRQTYEYDKPLQTATNKIKAKLPGLSKTLSPSVDTMGREILRYGGKNNPFNVFLNPANVNTENISESASEIYRVYKVTGDQTIMPRVTPYYINQKGEKTILSTKERTEYAKVSGKIIEDNIKLLLKNSNYVKLEDEEKSQIIKNIVDYSYNKAREDVVGIEMSNTYNGVKTYTMAKGQISDYYLAKKAVSDVKDKYKGDSTAMKNARKQAIFNYINKLNINKAEKAILFGVTTNYSIKSYRAYLFNYINKLDITKKEKEEIWNKLYD
nr:MAG TPA: PolyVal ADP-Ribosyltransferase [Caudoviricetes sp.]